MIKSGIYIIKNKITGRLYVGSSINFVSRFKEHKNDLRKNKHCNIYLRRVYNKDNNIFEFKIIEYVPDKKFLIKREQFWIDYYDSYNNGYNICPIAGNTLGFKMSEESRKKLSIANSGKNNGMYGKTHTKEARKKISECSKNREVTPEFITKMIIINSGKNNGMYGRSHSESAKKIIATKLKQRGGHAGKQNPNYGNKWKDRMKDKMKKSLILRGGYKGEKNPNYGNTKIKQEEWNKIILAVKEKREKVLALAKKYKVNIQTIYNILNKKGNYAQTT